MDRESTSVIIRPDLQAQVQEYDASGAVARFIGRRVAPIFRSAIFSGQYPIFRRADYKKMADSRRADDGSYNSIKAFFGQGTFTCDENGLKYPIDDARRRKYASLFDAEASASIILWFQLLLGHEYRVSQLFSGGGFTNTNVATAWSTAATAVPLTDLETGINSLCDKWGVAPGDISLIIPRVDYSEMLKTSQVNNKMLYTYPGVQPSLASPAIVAAMLGIKEVLVAASVYDSKEEGIAESNAMIWTAGVMFLTVLCGEDAPLDETSVARTILWTEDSPDIPVIESYRDDDRRCDIIRARVQTDEILLIDDTNPFVYQLTNT